MTHQPKGNKGLRRKLLQETVTANREMKKAILAASDALDASVQQIQALRRILISERAQLIYYSEKYLACLKHECLDLAPQNFLDLEEAAQEPFVKRAIIELSESQGIVPHEKSADQQSVAKKIVLPN